MLPPHSVLVSFAIQGGRMKIPNANYLDWRHLSAPHWDWCGGGQAGERWGNTEQKPIIPTVQNICRNYWGWKNSWRADVT